MNKLGLTALIITLAACATPVENEAIDESAEELRGGGIYFPPTSTSDPVYGLEPYAIPAGIDFGSNGAGPDAWTGGAAYYYGMVDCLDEFPNGGVVSEISLEYRNAADFRSGFQSCRKLRPATGTMGRRVEELEHFSHPRSGTESHTSVPTSELPVGLWVTSRRGKVVALNLAYASADEILDETGPGFPTSYSVSSSRAGAGCLGCRETAVLCAAGTVLTGINFARYTQNVGGPHQSELGDIYLACHELTYE